MYDLEVDPRTPNCNDIVHVSFRITQSEAEALVVPWKILITDAIYSAGTLSVPPGPAGAVAETWFRAIPGTYMVRCELQLQGRRYEIAHACPATGGSTDPIQIVVPTPSISSVRVQSEGIPAGCTSVTVSWVPLSIGGTVKIELLDGRQATVLKEGVSASARQATVTIPCDLDGDIQEAKMRVSSTGPCGSVEGISDHFAVTAISRLLMDAPSVNHISGGNHFIPHEDLVPDACEVTQTAIADGPNVEYDNVASPMLVAPAGRPVILHAACGTMNRTTSNVRFVSYDNVTLQNGWRVIGAELHQIRCERAQVTRFAKPAIRSAVPVTEVEVKLQRGGVFDAEVRVLIEGPALTSPYHQ
jgi:hypothetical protein